MCTPICNSHSFGWWHGWSEFLFLFFGGVGGDQMEAECLFRGTIHQAVWDQNTAEKKRGKPESAGTVNSCAHSWSACTRNWPAVSMIPRLAPKCAWSTPWNVFNIERPHLVTLRIAYTIYYYCWIGQFVINEFVSNYKEIRTQLSMLDLDIVCGSYKGSKFDDSLAPKCAQLRGIPQSREFVPHCRRNNEIGCALRISHSQ